MQHAFIENHDDIAACAALAASQHVDLVRAQAWLPARSAEDYLSMLEWMHREGVIVGAFEDDELRAFIAAFPLDDYRNAGKASLSPDWGHGFAPGVDPGRVFPFLYRCIAPRLLAWGARIHAFASYAVESAYLEALSMAGFGRVMMDASRPSEELARFCCEANVPRGINVTRACLPDSDDLAGLNARLAEHIAAPPVFMPDARGMTADEWREWLTGPDAIAFIARRGPEPLGFIKAETPQFDVSHAVRAPGTIGISGMYVAPAERGGGLAKGLLSALVRYAREEGYRMVSVDYETQNPEAFRFWRKGFEPLAYMLERRIS